MFARVKCWYSGRRERQRANIEELKVMRKEGRRRRNLNIWE